MVDNDLSLPISEIWLICQNLPNLTSGLSTLNVVIAFKTVHIMKARKISVPQPYYTSFQPNVQPENLQFPPLKIFRTNPVFETMEYKKSYLYIYFRNVYSPCLSVCLSGCLGGCGIKHTSRTLPGACDTSLEPSRQKKLIHEKKSRFARATRPQRAKTRSAHYISHFKTTVQRLGPLK